MMNRLPKCEIQQPNCCQPPAPGNVFLLVFTKAAPRLVDKGRQRSGRLRSSSPLVMRGRADRIEKQKNELSRPLWTACDRSELRKKLHRPACPQPWTQFRGWHRARSGKPAGKEKHGMEPARSDTILVCETHLFPRHRDQFSIARHTYTDFRPKRKWSWVIVPSGS